jgi:hypothetical protein
MSSKEAKWCFGRINLGIGPKEDLFFFNFDFEDLAFLSLRSLRSLR